MACAVCSVTDLNWRRSNCHIGLVLVKCAHPGASPPHHYEGPEAECHKPKLHTLGLAPCNPYD